MSIYRYAALETALCIGGNLHDGEVLMVRADEHDRELSALREERDQYQRVYNHASSDLCAIGELLGVPEDDQSTSAIIEAIKALREELAKFEEGMRALACSLGAGGYNAETLTADQLVGKVQWGIDNIITLQERRLAAAEQRNAELQVFDNFVGDLLDFCEGETIYEESLQRWLAESIERNKPTESGASDETRN